MSGRQGHGVVEEEHRGPDPGGRHGMAPTPVAEAADDPQVTPVVTNHVSALVDQASTVSGERPPL
jgi:hypothetical protein